MADSIANLQAIIGADVSGFQRGLADIRSGLSGIGGVIKALPIAGFLGAAISNADSAQKAVAQLDAALKSTGAAAASSAIETGKWVTATVGATALTKKQSDELERLRARHDDLAYAMSKSKHVTETQKVAFEQVNEKIAELEAKTGKAGQTVTYFQSSLAGVVPKPTRQALLDMADSFSKVTTFSREATIGAEAMLLTFTNVGKDVFPDATQAILDMSTAMGQDWKSSTEMIGKALQEPINGLTALRRVGVAFSATQEQQIKNFARSGNLMAAQKIILGELTTEFGGSAQAIGQTFGGQVSILQNKLGDLMEGFGNVLLPTLTGIVSAIGMVVDSLGTMDPAFQTLIAVGAVVALALSPIGAGFLAIATPIAAVTTAVLAVSAAFETNFGGIKDIVMGAYNALKPGLDMISGAVNGFLSNLGQTTETKAVTVNMSAHAKWGGMQTDADPGDQMVTRVITMQRTLGDRLQSAIAGAWPQFQAGLATLISNAKDWLNKAVPQLGDAITTAFHVSPAIGQIAGLVIVMLPLIGVASLVAHAIIGIGSAFLVAAAGILPFIAPLAIIVGLIGAYETNFGGFRDFVNRLGDGLRSLSPIAFVAAVAVGALAAAFVALGAPVIAVFAPLLIVGGLVLAYANNWLGFRDTIDKIREAFEKLADAIGHAVMDKLLNAQKTVIGVKGILSSLVGDQSGVQYAAAQMDVINKQLADLNTPSGGSASAQGNGTSTPVPSTTPIDLSTGGTGLTKKIFGGGGAGKGQNQAVMRSSLDLGQDDGSGGGAAPGQDATQYTALATAIDKVTTAIKTNNEALTGWRAQWTIAGATLTTLMQTTFGAGGSAEVSLTAFHLQLGLYFDPGGLLDTAVNNATATLQKLMEAFPKVSAALAGAFKNVVDIVTTPFRNALAVIGRILMQAAAASPFFAGLGGAGATLAALGNAKGFAQGGYTGSGSGIAGVVHGGEFVVPQNGALVLRDSGGGGGGGGITITGPINVYGVQNPKEMYEAIMDEAKTRNKKPF